MKLTLRVIAWLVLSCTHVLGSIEICGATYVAYIIGFIGTVILYERFAVSYTHLTLPTILLV